ncbi:MAG: head GIN domain-containing protein [Ferruginibacter sp.]
MKVLLVLLSTVFCLSVTAQKTTTFDDPNAKARTLNGSFTAISVSDGIELYLTAGTAESIAVSFADEKYEEKFKTEVEDGVLKIWFDNRGINYNDNKRRKLKAWVSFKTLEKLTASGGANVKLASAISVNDFEMKFSSGSLFEGEVKSKTISLDLSSGAVVTMSGSAEKITLDAGSGAIFKGYEFTTDYCNAKASSGGDVRISVGKELTANANSGGGIHYKGTAVIKDINISSGGVVKKA